MFFLLFIQILSEVFKSLLIPGGEYACPKSAFDRTADFLVNMHCYGCGIRRVQGRNRVEIQRQRIGCFYVGGEFNESAFFDRLGCDSVIEVNRTGGIAFPDQRNELHIIPFSRRKTVNRICRPQINRMQKAHVFAPVEERISERRIVKGRYLFDFQSAQVRR